MSQGALFRHFPTRQALLVATAEHVAHAQRGSLPRHSSTSRSTPSRRGRRAGPPARGRPLPRQPDLARAARRGPRRRRTCAPRCSRRASCCSSRCSTPPTTCGPAGCPADDIAAVLSIVVNMLDGLAFSALDPDPGRTAGPHRRARPAPARRDDRPPLPRGTLMSTTTLHPRRDRRRRRPGRPRRHPRAGAGRQAGAAARPGEPPTTSAARPGGRSAACSSSTAPSSAGWASRTPPSSPGRTGRARRSSTGSATAPTVPAAARTSGRSSGPRRTSTSRTEEKRDYLHDLGPEVAALRRLGRARRRPRHRPRQLGAALPPHVGHRPRGRADLRRAGRAGRGGRGSYASASATRSTSWSSRTARVVGVRGTVLADDDSERGVKSSRDAAGEFEHRPPRSSSPAAASATTTS